MGIKMSCPLHNRANEQLLPYCKERMMLEFEATEFGTSGTFIPDEPIEVFTQRAISRAGDIDNWRASPCWVLYEKALLCWFKSTAQWKGIDCYDYQMAVRNCVKAHPEHHPEEAEQMR